MEKHLSGVFFPPSPPVYSEKWVEDHVPLGNQGQNILKVSDKVIDVKPQSKAIKTTVKGSIVK